MRFWRGAASLRSAGQPRRLSPHIGLSATPQEEFAND